MLYRTEVVPLLAAIATDDTILSSICDMSDVDLIARPTMLDSAHAGVITMGRDGGRKGDRCVRKRVLPRGIHGKRMQVVTRK